MEVSVLVCLAQKLEENTNVGFNHEGAVYIVYHFMICLILAILK